MEPRKQIHTIILDAGPLLNNDPPISTLLSRSETIFTIPAIISEIKDRDARTRLEATVLPFLTIRTPSPASIKAVSDFARRTGDLQVLSKPDLQVLALAYELECERNKGDWRLRKVPGQKGLNGSPPSSKHDADSSISNLRDQGTDSEKGKAAVHLPDPIITENPSGSHAARVTTSTPAAVSDTARHDQSIDSDLVATDLRDVSSKIEVEQGSSQTCLSGLGLQDQTASDSASSDSEGWITPSNLTKQQAKDQNKDATPIAETTLMQVATITGDFAMQNVLLQMNLNLLSTSLRRIRHLKTYILRCHACFEKTKDMTKQFCPRCGKPTLTRVACSTSANGEFKIHLKKNMQWNTRGDRFSIPKPVAGTANGKVGASKGGGKGGWGQELILAEDQKEYLQAMTGQSRRKERNLMDEDYLPGILTGDRRRAGGRPKVGAGRNVNSKKR